eukprot:Nk52_evm75s554 gene=Nk52_evmTU75s554
MGDSEGKKCQWGVVSTANIARKFIDSLKSTRNGKLRAVASRNAEKAEQYVKELGEDVTKVACLGDYDSLLDMKDIKAVYIPVPTSMKKDIAIKCAWAGKHVLVEKPFASESDLTAIVTACKQNGVFFLDGTMFVHHKRTEEVLDKISNGEIGDPQTLLSTFDYYLDPDVFARNIRADPTLEPLGTLGDLAWYNVRLSLLVYDWMLPKRVFATPVYYSPGCSKKRFGFELKEGEMPDKFVIRASGMMEFDDGRTSMFDVGWGLATSMSTLIVGSKKQLQLSDQYLPWKTPHNFPQNGGDNTQGMTSEYIISDVGNETRYEVEHCVQEIRMMERVGDIALGKDQVQYQWAECSLKNQKVLDALFKSLQTNEFVYL